MSEIVYKRHFVAFFDILGFSDIVSAKMSATEAKEKIVFLNSALTSCRELFATRWSWEEDTFTVSMFSDCVCVAIPARWENLDAFFQILGYLQSQLALNGIAIRGAVTVGKYFSNEQLIFSSALVEAYKIESDNATPPCIVVSDSLRTHIYKRHPSPMSKHLAVTLDYFRSVYVFRDPQNVMFVDYMNFMPAAADNGERLMTHRNWIIESLKEYEQIEGVHKKYRWLRDYHNRWCEKFEHEWRGYPDLLIPG